MLLPEIRIGVIGNVDVGKSSLISVLTNNILDNGRGSARNYVLKHPHEKQSGRTSSMTLNFLRLFYNQEEQLMTDQYYDELKNDKYSKDSCEFEKTVTLVDLAGHEKYLKTTIQGINGSSLDYVAILVGSNSGVQRMTKEHMELACGMNIPIFLVFTKIDMTPKNVIKDNITYIKMLFKKKKYKIINTKDDDDIKMMNNFYQEQKHKKIIPLFKLSSVTGEGITKFKKFISNLKNMQSWSNNIEKEPNFLIESTYSIKGIGLVVSGMVKQGRILKGDTLNIGPIKRKYYNVLIKNIHNNHRENVDQLQAGEGGCFAIKFLDSKSDIKRNMIKKGIRISKNIRTYTDFEAEIVILHHPTTITRRYQPMVHCCGISQSAKICDMEKECMRSGDRSKVHFKLMYRPEFIEPNNYLVFREGNTRGIGKILNVY